MDGSVLPPVASLMGKLAHENAPYTTSDPPGRGGLDPFPFVWFGAGHGPSYISSTPLALYDTSLGSH